MPLKKAPQVGRPRCFDTEQALQKALDVFWAKGYQSASLADLTEAMGINKPSLYATYGNKQELFLQAIDAYEKRPQAFFFPALEQPKCYQVVETLLKGLLARLSDPSQPQCCMLIHSALSSSESEDPIKEYLQKKRATSSDALHQRFLRAQKEQDLSPEADPEALAHYLSTVMQGLNVHATNGASLKQLESVASLTLATFEGLCSGSADHKLLAFKH